MTAEINSEQLQRMAEDPSAFRALLRVPMGLGVGVLGDVQADFQRRDFGALDGSLLRLAGRDPGGRKLYSRAWIERTKGGSKDTDAAVSALWLLIFTKRPLLLQIGAVDKEQAGRIKQAANEIIRLNPWIGEAVRSHEWKLINRAAGAELEIIAHDVGGTHGARPDALWLNELAHFPSRDFADACLSNVAKKPGALLVVCTNAGFVDSYAAKLRLEAQQSERWYFSVLDTPAPWISKEDVAEQSRILPAAMADRLWRGVWSAGEGDAFAEELDSVICMESPSPPHKGWQIFAGLDIGVRHDATAFVAVAKNVGWYDEFEDDAPLTNRQRMMIEAGLLTPPSNSQVVYVPGSGALRLACVRTWRPTDGKKVNLIQVERELVQLYEQLRWEVMGIDPHQAERPAQEFETKGIPISLIDQTPASLQEMATVTLDAFRSRMFSMYRVGAESLIADLRVARLVENVRGFRIASPKKVKGSEDATTGHGDTVTALQIALLLAKRSTARSAIVEGDLFIYP